MTGPTIHFLFIPALQLGLGSPSRPHVVTGIGIDYAAPRDLTLQRVTFYLLITIDFLRYFI